jgi:hypothetical protein
VSQSYSITEFTAAGPICYDLQFTVYIHTRSVFVTYASWRALFPASLQGDQIGRKFAKYIRPLGDCLLWAVFRKLQKNFFNGKGHALILTKKGWATFWVTFSQTHLVTLQVLDS